MIGGGRSLIPGKLAKGLGGVTMVLGAVLVVMAFSPLKRFFSGNKEWMDAFAALIAVTMVLIPGVLVILGGYRFLHEVNLPNVKVLAGVYSAFGALCLRWKLANWFPGASHPKAVAGFLTLGVAVFGILAYLLAMRWLVPAMGMKWSGYRSILGKGAFVLLAWLLWSALMAASQEVPRDYFHSGFSLIFLFGPILIAWIFYECALSWLARGKNEKPRECDLP